MENGEEEYFASPFATHHSPLAPSKDDPHDLARH